MLEPLPLNSPELDLYLFNLWNSNIIGCIQMSCVNDERAIVKDYLKV